MRFKLLLTILIFAAAALIASAMPGYASSPDLDGDGYPDIVISNWAGSSSVVYYGAATDPYSRSTTIATYGAHGNTVADVDADGTLDIVFNNTTASYWTSNIFWGSSYSTNRSLVNSYGVSSSVADIDKDGKMDIAIADYRGSNSSYVYWGAGSRTFSSATAMATGPDYGAYGSAIADLNKDGKLDLVFTNTAGNMYIFGGNGDRTFSSPVTVAAGTAASCSIADLNGDGKLDIVVANLTDNSNSYIFWGDGTLNYSASAERRTALSTIGRWRGSNVADLDNDGYLDILITSQTDNTDSYIYWGDASASYASSTTIASRTPCGSAIGDLDGDGILDIVLSNFAAGASSYIYYGLGERDYSTATTLATTQGFGVAIAGSNIWGANNGLGNVMPLWATQGGYGWDILSSWQYEFIALKNELMNSGALDLSDEEIAKLTKLYFDGKGGGDPDPVSIDGIIWKYFAGTDPEHTTPSYWYDDENYYFQFGSGVTTDQDYDPVSTPEPATVAGVAGIIVLAMRKIRRKNKKGD